MQRLLTFTLIFQFFIAFSVSKDVHDNDQPPKDESSNQLSWQSAFWGLVGIALNTAAQPSGRIAGLPSSWGPALKFSPLFCIINMFEALESIRLVRRGYFWAPVVSPHKYIVDERAGQSDVAALQQNTLLRVLAFILGPVMQATKLYACRGIFWTQVLATIYLGSFLCDEFVLCLVWLTRPTVGQNRVTGLAEAVMGRPEAATDSSDALMGRSEAAMDNSEAALRSSPSTTKPNKARLLGGVLDPNKIMIVVRDLLIWMPATMFLLWFAGNVAAGIQLKVQPVQDSRQITATRLWFRYFGALVIPSLTAIVYGIISFKRRNRPLRIIEDVFFGFFVNAPSLFFLLVETSVNIADVRENGVITFEVDLTCTDGIVKLLEVYNTFLSGLWALGEYGNLDRYGVAKPVRITLALWASAHLTTALAMYILSHDPSQTFQPSWTNVLG